MHAHEHPEHPHTHTRTYMHTHALFWHVLYIAYARTGFFSACAVHTYAHAGSISARAVHSMCTRRLYLGMCCTYICTRRLYLGMCCTYMCTRRLYLGMCCTYMCTRRLFLGMCCTYMCTRRLYLGMCWAAVGCVTHTAWTLACWLCWDCWLTTYMHRSPSTSCVLRAQTTGGWCEAAALVVLYCLRHVQLLCISCALQRHLTHTRRVRTMCSTGARKMRSWLPPCLA